MALLAGEVVALDQIENTLMQRWTNDIEAFPRYQYMQTVQTFEHSLCNCSCEDNKSQSSVLDRSICSTELILIDNLLIELSSRIDGCRRIEGFVLRFVYREGIILPNNLPIYSHLYSIPRTV